MIKLDILSDPICPWCYIGKTYLDRALAAHPDHPFTIEWHPFQLNPEMPEGGMERRAYLEAKFGGTQGALDAYRPIVERAEAEGMEIDFGAIQRTPNTLNAHRLIHWAGIEGRQTPVVSFLFEAYFKQGLDIGDKAVLIDIAKRAEMDSDLVQRLLDSDADVEDTRARDAHARQRGVTGVPCFIVHNQHVLPGAQPTELWEQVIDEVLNPGEQPVH
ncbi:putative DSBA oxidoreductase [Actibacterium atlanticum]|uniref:Putative DSBA oxidoreductase n=1 Tax=Actibacterium atlanticum TaxID=1461693 RepID=A0A058ZQ78_9RHOB|nr:DsbA family oxidoreductase [Actibacterium atlanticum]KCV83703.1 putative DSBA oxidoreductase [Actibacterium atlanticum]